jgi:large exoprotein involved in heme utilization and adhesion
LTLDQGASVSSSAFGSGDGGNVSIAVAGDAQLSGAGTGISSRAEGGGAGGSVILSAQDVTLTDGSVISAASTGTGDAGNIDVTAVGSVTLQDSAITTRAAVADGGNVKITADNMVYLNASEVTAAVGTGQGDGGNVVIDPEFVVLASSRILANAFGGNGGNITIITDHFVGSADSVLDASSELGIDGTVNILSPDEDVDSNLVELPVAYQDAAGLLRERCSARHLSDRSSLTMSGRKGVPSAPGLQSMMASSISDSLPASSPSGGSGVPVAGAATASNYQGALLPAGFLGAAVWGCSL